MTTLFRCFLLQVIEDISYFELENRLRENTVAKWFCNFSLTQITPSYKELKSIRRKIGISLLIELLSLLNKQLEIKGYITMLLGKANKNELIAQNKRWKKRDQAIYSKLLALENKAC